MKENKIEKLILDLSAAWKCSPEEVVDRLNSMNESEINKLIESMTKKFQMGGSFEDRVAFGTTERPRNFNPAKINPISKREAMQKYAGFGYNRGQLRRIYNRAAEYLGKENAAKGMSAAGDQRAPGQTGYLVPAEEQKQGGTKVSAMQGPEMPVTNSDPQYVDRPRNFKFENGGMIDCLRAGGSLTECKKCGGKTPIKAQGGEKLVYDRPSWGESTFGAFSDSTKHPRQDGKGHYTAEILPSGDTLTTVVGPYTTFTERRMEDGSGRFFDVIHKDFSNRYYDPKRKDEGGFRDPVPADTKEMFDNIRNRFETPADTKAREIGVMKALINLMKANKSGGTK